MRAKVSAYIPQGFALASLPALALFMAAAPAQANNGGVGGCSAGFEFIAVDLVPPAYWLARAIDEAGNADGYVCRRPLGRGLLHQYPAQIYLWKDNEDGPLEY